VHPFFILSQSGERPARYIESFRFDKSHLAGVGEDGRAVAFHDDYNTEQSWKNFVNADGSIRSTPRGGWGFP
jgi:hypothetical protein